jgi:hypothetical protein
MGTKKHLKVLANFWVLRLIVLRVKLWLLSKHFYLGIISYLSKKVMALFGAIEDGWMKTVAEGTKQ